MAFTRSPDILCNAMRPSQARTVTATSVVRGPIDALDSMDGWGGQGRLLNGGGDRAPFDPDNDAFALPLGKHGSAHKPDDKLPGRGYVARPLMAAGADPTGVAHSTPPDPGSDLE